MIYITNRRNQNDFLIHHGIKGQKWGVRRFQNEDGSLTPAGRERYGSKNGNVNESAREAIENGAKNYSDPVDKIMAVTKDCVSASLPWSYIRKAGNEERMLKAADLGLKAMVKFGYGDTEWLREDSPEDHKNLQEWFLWEDQTIGLPMVADLVNQGYTSNQIKKMIDIVNQNRRKWWERHDREGVSEDHELADAIVFDIHEGNYNNMLKDFADACEQVKKGG